MTTFRLTTNFMSTKHSFKHLFSRFERLVRSLVQYKLYDIHNPQFGKVLRGMFVLLAY